MLSNNYMEIIIVGDNMKKLLLLILLFPSLVFAYSNYLIMGGDTLGVEVNSKGIIVVGFYKIDNEYINRDLKVGDTILEVNDIEVNSTSDLVNVIDKYMIDNKVSIEYDRNGKIYEDELDLKYESGTYKTGLYVKSSILGIGTLTYLDPNTGVYGILGHSLNLSKTNKRIEVREGYTYNAKVINFTRSKDGNPGSKNADIDKNSIFGTIEINTRYGVFGKVKNMDDTKLVEVGKIDDVNTGKAYIYTTNLDNKIEKYEIKILEINKYNSDKNFYFEIVDKDLINMSGGIVQGMSGSPIIQDGKIIGAVTRVLVDDVSRGYGLSIVKMLEEGDKIVEGQ